MTAVMLLTGMTLWGQTNYSTTYTSNVTLSTEGGTSATTCKVIIDGTPYDGIKAGTGNIAGAWKVTVPAGTEYLHLHVAAWKNDNVTLTVTPSNLVDDIVLTSNNGISSNSPFTFDGDPSTDDYYKVIVLGNLSEDTDLTFTATTGKRFVVFGVNSDNGNPSTPIVATPTFSPAGGTYFEAQTVSITCATEGATIHFTTDGTDPTENSDVYGTPLDISETTTVKAKAWKDGYEASNIASATYTIEEGIAFNRVSNHAVVAGSTYLIVDLHSGRALTSANGTTGSPTAVPVYFNADSTQVTTGNAQLQWTFETADGGYIIHPTENESEWLYCIAENTGARVGTGEANIWTINVTDDTKPNYHGFLNNAQERYLGVYNNQDWRTYITINNNIQDTQIELFVMGDAPQPTPTLAVTPTSLGGLDYAYGEGPSDAQACTVSGTLLNESVTVTAPESFEIGISADGSFGGSLVLEPVSGTLSATAVHVRLAAGLDPGSYSGVLTVACGDLSQTVALSGSVGEMPVVATPTFSVEEGTYLTPQTVSIACATEGATIHYTTDGTDPTENSTVYSEPIEVTATMTLKAMATAENHSNSGIASATYTIYEPANISDIRNLPNNTYACMEGTVILIDGRNVYVQDGTAGIDLYLNNNTVPAELALGDVVRAYGKKTVYNGLIELTGINGNNPNEFSIISNGNTLPLEVRTIAEINADFNDDNLLQSTRVKIENAIIGAINYNGITVISQDRAELNIYHLPYVEGLIEGDIVTVIGVIGCYNAPQLLVASADDVEFIHSPSLNATPISLSGLDYDYETGGPSEIDYFLLSGEHLIDDVKVYPSEHFEVSTYGDDLFHPENPAIVYTTTGNFFDIKIYVRLMAGLEPGTYTEQLSVVSEGAQTIYVTVTGTVYGDGPTPPPASGDYVRISSLSELAVGSQVVFAARFDENATSYYAMSNQSSGKPTGVLFTSTTSGSDEILPTSIVDEESSFYWTVGMTANGYTFTNADGELIGYTSSTNFATGGDNTEWGIELGTAGDEAMVPGYTGFVITNVNNETRHFALNSNHNFGPYHTNNINSSGYNFYLDIFVKGEGGGTPTVATPTFTPEGGTYYEPQTVSITCATEGATIHYTLDGTDPTEASPVYGAPILINATTTVKAFAVKDDYDDSAIATAIYLYNEELHDDEDMVLTIQDVQRAWTPWNDKRFNMNQYFNRK